MNEAMTIVYDRYLKSGWRIVAVPGYFEDLAHGQSVLVIWPFNPWADDLNL